MPALQVRDCPADLYEDLKAFAAEEDRSIAQECTHILREYLNAHKHAKTSPEFMVISHSDSNYDGDEARLNTREARIAKRKALFERINALPELDLPAGLSDTAALIEEARNDRLNVASSLESAF